MPCTSPPWPCILLTLDLPVIDFRVLFWIFSSNRLFKAVRVDEPTETRNRPFLNVKFANKGIDTLNVSNILNQKSVQNKIPPCFQYKEWSCISYSYTRSVASKIFNYKASLQQLDFQVLYQDPPPCNCSDSQFLYAPCGPIVTGDLNIVRNIKLRDLLGKGPKYREPVSYSWHQNFGIIMDACEEYARRWAKKEDVEADTLSEWIKSIADVLKRRIRRFNPLPFGTFWRILRYIRDTYFKSIWVNTINS